MKRLIFSMWWAAWVLAMFWLGGFDLGQRDTVRAASEVKG